MGDRWIGLAAGDSAAGLSTPLRTMRRSSRASDVAAVRRAAEAEGAAAVIVGLPRNMDGSLGAQAERAMRFAAEVRAAGLEVVYCDERLSSFEAEQYVAATRGRRPRPGERIDHIAAAIIVQDYLNASAQPPHTPTTAPGCDDAAQAHDHVHDVRPGTPASRESPKG